MSKMYNYEGFPIGMLIYTPRRLTYPPPQKKMMLSNRNLLFQKSIFRCKLSFFFGGISAISRGSVNAHFFGNQTSCGIMLLVILRDFPTGAVLGLVSCK